MISVVLAVQSPFVDGLYRQDLPLVLTYAKLTEIRPELTLLQSYLR